MCRETKSPNHVRCVDGDHRFLMQQFESPFAGLWFFKLLELEVPRQVKVKPFNDCRHLTSCDSLHNFGGLPLHCCPCPGNQIIDTPHGVNFICSGFSGKG